VNAPTSKELPNLRYQYIMNEPFIGGVNDTVQSSHEANVHKRRVAYDLDAIEQAQEETMTVAERKERLLQEVVEKIQADKFKNRQNVTAEDANVLMVTENRQEYFGLTIEEKKAQQLALVDFDIERRLTLAQFLRLIDQDSLLDGGQLKNDGLMKVRDFLRKNWLIKLSIIDALDEDMSVSDLDD